jgi:flagellar basal-body rod protein FlgB
VNDVTMDALHGLLRGLAARQRTISDNIANIETPGFKAKRVEFENALADALASGRSADVKPSIVASNNPALPNGNNVAIDQEIVALEDTQLRYQLAIEAMTAKLAIIRSSMRSSI